MPKQPPKFRTLFTLWNVPFTYNNQSWKFVPPKLAIGLVVAYASSNGAPPNIWIPCGLIYGVLLLLVLCLHILGHMLSSKHVTPPMTEARITPVLIQTLYQKDSASIPARTHLIRSLGGPTITFLLGVTALLAYSFTQNPFVGFFAGTNFAILLIVLLPFPTVDGEVIWRELSKMMRERRV